jgi:hypothetical protein
MFPPTKQAAVDRALVAAFGTGFTKIQVLQAHAPEAAHVYRIEVAGRPYLLRLAGQIHPLVDPARAAAFTRIATDAGFAPPLHHLEPEVLIADFIETRPFPPDAGTQLATLIARVHALPPWPHAVDYLATIDAFLQRFQAVAAPELVRGYEQISRAYPRDPAGWVPSHNDLKPPNTLFDGRRFWLVDWEAAFQNDPYVDLAVVANFHMRDEAAFLAAYFGRPATPHEHARFFLMQQAVHAFYAAMFLSLAARAGLPIDPTMDLPSFEEVHRQVVAKVLDLEGAEGKVPYGLAHLRRAEANMRSARFQEALALL